jgi:RecA/RadA recombinase
MGRPPKTQTTLNSQLEEYLKKNADYHYAGEEDVDYIVSSGSLIMDIEMGGGIRPGIIRSSGVTEGGKTSNALAFAKNFQDLHQDNGQVIYIKSEGRLSKEILERAGVSTDEARFKVIPTNDYEFVIDLMRNLIRDNPEKKLYFFILDSLDALVPRNDLQKSATEANKTAGSALLTSDLLRKMAAGFASRGHICFIISQVRSTIKINPYEKGDPKVTNASGGNAALHYSDWIFEFQQRYQKDIIKDKNDKPIGHWCKIIFRKTPNEKTGIEIKYPIKHGRKNGQSVWIEYEIIDSLLMFEMITCKGAWVTVSNDVISEVEAAGLKIDQQHQGIDNFRAYLEANPKLVNFFFEKFKQALKK